MFNAWLERKREELEDREIQEIIKSGQTVLLITDARKVGGFSDLDRYMMQRFKFK